MSSNQHPAWTDAEIETLRKLVPLNWSAGKIGLEMGRTRNSIISKCHRVTPPLRLRGVVTTRGLNLPPRKRTEHERAWRPKVVPQHAFTAEPVDAPAPVPQTAKRLSIMQLTERTCKFPLGDPREPSFAYCGVDIEHGDVYCSHHALIAWREPPPRIGAPFALRRVA